MVKPQNLWTKLQRDKLIQLFGGKCVWTGETAKLEFAHVDKTPLSGVSKGRSEGEVYYDIIKHPHSYVLLTRRAHLRLDLSDGKPHDDMLREVKRRQRIILDKHTMDELYGRR